MSIPMSAYSANTQNYLNDVPEELQCLYSQSTCFLERYVKENGERHNLCEYHRDKANAAQRRSAKKKRDENRRKRMLRLAQEEASKTCVPINDLLNSICFETPISIDDGEVSLINGCEAHDDLRFENMTFSEEDLNWLTEALLSSISN